MEQSCRVGPIEFTDTSDPKSDRTFFGSEVLAQPNSRDYVGRIRAQGRARYRLEVEIDGMPLPSVLIAEEANQLRRRLEAVKREILIEYDEAGKIAALEARRQQLEEQLEAAQATAGQARDRAARLTGKGRDARKEHEAALLADECERSVKAALGLAQTTDHVRAGLFNQLEARLRSEAGKIRAEVQARHAEACQWLALAVSGQPLPERAQGRCLLREVAVTTALGQLVPVATPAQRSIFGSAVGWLDKQVNDLGLLPGYAQPRSARELGAPMSVPASRGF
jgi:hypothetical protein